MPLLHRVSSRLDLRMYRGEIDSKRVLQWKVLSAERVFARFLGACIGHSVTCLKTDYKQLFFFYLSFWSKCWLHSVMTVEGHHPHTDQFPPALLSLCCSVFHQAMKRPQKGQKNEGHEVCIARHCLPRSLSPRNSETTGKTVENALQKRKWTPLTEEAKRERERNWGNKRTLTRVPVLCQSPFSHWYVFPVTSRTSSK